MSAGATSRIDSEIKVNPAGSERSVVGPSDEREDGRKEERAALRKVIAKQRCEWARSEGRWASERSIESCWQIEAPGDKGKERSLDG